jgi:N-acetylmuramoyl-L-alanine amidase
MSAYVGPVQSPDPASIAGPDLPARAARRALWRGNAALLVSLLLLLLCVAGGLPAAQAQSNWGSVTGALASGQDLHIDLTPTTPLTGVTGVSVVLYDQNGRQIPSSQIQVTPPSPQLVPGSTTHLNVHVSGLAPNILRQILQPIASVVYQAAVILDVYVNVGPPPPIVVPPPLPAPSPQTVGLPPGAQQPIPAAVAGAASVVAAPGPGGLSVNIVQVAVTPAAVQAAAAQAPPSQPNIVVQVPSTGATQVSELSLPGSVVAAAAQTGKGLAVAAPQGTVVLPPKVLTTLQQTLAPTQAALVRVQPVPPAVQQQAQAAAQTQQLVPAATPVDLAILLQDTLSGQILGPVQPSGGATVQVSLPFDTTRFTGMDALRLGVYSLDPNTQQWVYAGGKVDLASGTVSAQVSHLSIWSVLEDTRTFTDLASAPWAQDDLLFLLAHHVVQGVAPGLFAPNAPMTRAQFASLLVQGLGLQVPTGQVPTGFSDVPAGAWYAGAVAAASRAGVLRGYPDGTFRPDAPISRQELAVMAVNAMAAAGQAPAALPPGQVAATLAGFADGAAVAPWAAQAMAQAVSEHIVQGEGGGLLAPTGQATRAEAAVIVKRLLTDLGLL